MPKINGYLLMYRSNKQYLLESGGTGGVNNAHHFREEVANDHKNHPGIRPDIVFIKIEDDGKLTKMY